jgi:hypothetical protein
MTTQVRDKKAPITAILPCGSGAFFHPLGPEAVILLSFKSFCEFNPSLFFM